MARLVTGVALAALLLPLVAHGYLGTFTRYHADDYCTAGILLAQGFLPAQSYWYTTWSGRYSFTLGITAVESFGLGIVPLLPALTLVVWLAAATWMVSRLAVALRWPSPLPISLLLGALLVFAVLESTPDVGQSLYWQTGVVTYVWPLVLLTLYVGWLLDRARDVPGPSARPLSLALSAAIPFVAGGFSETYAATQTGVLVVAAAIVSLVGSAAHRRTLLPLLVAGVVGSALAMLVVAISPGNAVRRIGQPEPDLLLVGLSSAEFAVISAGKFLLRTPVSAIIAVLLPALIAFAWHPSDLWPRAQQKLVSGEGRALLVLAAAVFGVLMVGFAPAFYGIGYRPPDRALVTSQFVLVLGAAAAGYLGGLALRRTRLAALRAQQYVAALGLVALALVALGPVVSTARTLGQVETASRYAATWDEVDGAIRVARDRGELDLVVPPLPNTSNVPHFDFVAPDPNDWFNVCVARYYRINSIAAGRTATY